MLTKSKSRSLESVAEATPRLAQEAGRGGEARRNLIDIETDKVVLDARAGDGVLVNVAGDKSTVVAGEVIAHRHRRKASVVASKRRS
jgi:hypothetical protein